MPLKEYDQMFERYYDLDDPNEIEVMDKVTDEAREILVRCKECFSLNNKLRDERIIVSVTSIPKRLESVIYPIQCMLIQTVKPDKIILWLDIQRLKDELLPQELLELKQYGLEICYVEDVGPHTKYFYAMKQYPGDIIITIDDDLLYQRTLVEGLVEAHKKHPKYVCAYWAWQMKFTCNGIPYPSSEYRVVDETQNESPDSAFVALGFGGVLYPPYCLDARAFDADKIKELAFKADDVWLKAMEVLNHVQVIKVAGRMPYPHIKGSQAVALQYENMSGNNDIVIKNVFRYYGIEQYFKKIDKMENNKVHVLLKWVDSYQRSLKLSDFLLAKGIHTVAIYGMGQLGKLLLGELQGSAIQVKYGIDQKVEGAFYTVPIFRLKDVQEEVDIVIIAAPISRQEVLPYIKSDMISIEDLLVEMSFYAEK